jgi:serine/threonine-protein kinase HipA
MSSKRPTIVTVYADLDQFAEPAVMGSLRCQTSRTGDIFSFEYDDNWLQRATVFTFDPDLALDETSISGTGPRELWHFPRLVPGPTGTRSDAEARKPPSTSRRASRAIPDGVGISCSEYMTKPGWARYASEIPTLRDTSTVMINSQHHRSPRFANFRPPVLNLNPMQTTRNILTTNRGSPNCSRQGHPLAALVPKHPSATKRVRSVWQSFPGRQDRRDIGAWELVAHRLAVKVGAAFRRRVVCAPLTAATRLSSPRDSIAHRQIGGSHSSLR